MLFLPVTLLVQKYPLNVGKKNRVPVKNPSEDTVAKWVVVQERWSPSRWIFWIFLVFVVMFGVDLFLVISVYRTTQTEEI